MLWFLFLCVQQLLTPTHLPCPCLVSSVFLLFNIALGAYILGTITLLVVKNDERTGRYRDLSTNLKTYR